MKNKFITLLLFILLFVVFAIAFILYQNNRLLDDKLKNRETFIKVLENKDSLNSAKFQKNIDSLKMLGKNLSYVSDGKKVTIADIINSANKWFIEKETYKNDLKFTKANLKIYKDAYEDCRKISQENNQNANKRMLNDNAVIKSLDEVVKKYSPEKYREYEFYYKTVKSNYGLDYSVKKDNDSTRTFTFSPNSKLDSALALFEDWKKGRLKININIIKESKKKKN